MTTPRCPLSTPSDRHWLGAVLAAGVIAFTSLLMTVPASAQSNDVRALASTIDRLERQLQTLERAVYRGGASPAPSSGATSGGGSVPPAAISQLQFKTTQLEEQMRGLTGQIEEMGFQITNISARLDRLVADVDFRLRALEGNNPQSGAPQTVVVPPTSPLSPPVATGTPPPAAAAPAQPGSGSLGSLTQRQIDAANINRSGANTNVAAVTPSAPQPPAPAVPATLPAGSAQDRYEYARGFLMRRDFPGAERALRAFVDSHPEDALAGNAQYWLGETYYVRKDYATAARTFAEGFQRYPDSNKAPDNLLKLGLSLSALERRDDACITLAKLETEYPQVPANIKRRADQERTRLRC